MTASEVIATAATVLLSLGGGAAIVFGLSSWLGRLWASRIMEGEKAKYSQELEALKSRFLLETEKYKTSLKKSEFIFEKEYQAASELVALVRSLRPTYAHPDMDWHEACDDIARSFDESERALERFLSRHGAVLDEPTRDAIARCISIAAQGKFDVAGTGEVPREANEAADQFYAMLQRAETAVVSTVRNQARA